MKNDKINDNIKISGARIVFRNFSGKEGKFNKDGMRNFCVLLEEDLARTLEEDGWNVRWLKPRDDQENEQGYLQVSVRYDNMPPKIYMITGKDKKEKKTLMDEATVSILDWAETSHIDLVIKPYNWTIQEGTPNEKKGVKAYVKSMYITLVEDEFESKYYDVPDSAESCLTEKDGD